MTGWAATKKCDAKRCGSPATVNDRMGGRFCRGHSYLAAPAPNAEAAPVRAEFAALNQKAGTA